MTTTSPQKENLQDAQRVGYTLTGDAEANKAGRR